MVILEFQNNFKFFPISCQKNDKFCPPKTTLLGNLAVALTPIMLCIEILKFAKLIEQISKKNIL
jgi:hypothetical protein